MRKFLALAFFVLIASFVLVPALSHGASAQQAITVLAEQPTNEFPRGVSFAITFTAPAGSKEVRLQYHLAPDGTGATAVATCAGDTTVSCTFTLTSGAGIFIIPGAEITYHWEITDKAANKLSTPDKLYTHEDTRFTFNKLQRDNITLYYHSGSATQARAVLDAAAETISRVGALEKTQVTFPVKVFLYATAEQMQPSIAPGGQGRGVTVLGEVVYSDTAMVSADAATLDITRHEVAHIVTRAAMKGPFDIPSWLNEGISVYSQSRPLSSQESSLQSAIRSNTALSVKELNSSASGSAGATVDLYYGQAGAIARLLIEAEGADKFAQLLSTVKSGNTFDKALQTVYGFDSLGMENAWRGSVGLPPRAASATATPQSTQQARSAPTSPKGAASASPASAGSGTSSTATVIIVALAAVLLLTIAVAAIVVVRRM